MMGKSIFVTLLRFGFLVQCHSWGCLLQRNATHHLVEPCNEERNRPALALAARQLATRQSHRLHVFNDPAPAGHGAPAPAGHGAAPAEGGAETPTAASPSAKKPAAKQDLTSALRIELSMPLTIREIHEGPQGPLSHFLVVVHQQLCKSANVPPQRLSLLGIRGEYTKLETMLVDSSTLDGKGDILLLDDNVKQEDDVENQEQVAAAAQTENPHGEAAADPHAAKKEPAKEPAKDSAPVDQAKEGAKEATPSPDPAASSADHEVIVDMEILPGAKSSDAGAQDIFEKLKKTLQDPQSLLRTGPVGGMLSNGELSYGNPPNPKDSIQQKAHEGLSTGCVPNMMIMLVLTFLSYGFM